MHPINVAEIHELNLRYLTLLQKTAQDNSKAARQLFGVSAAVLSEIAQLTADEIAALARTNSLLFKGKLSDALLNDALESSTAELDEFHDFTIHFLTVLLHTARTDVFTTHQVFGLPLAVCKHVATWHTSRVLRAARMAKAVNIEGCLTTTLLTNFRSTQSPAIRGVMSLAHNGGTAA